MIKIKTELDDIKEIVAKYPEAWKECLENDGDIYADDKLYSDLFEYYSTDPDYMPYGIQKARDGDPVQWITERLDDLGAFEEEAEFTDNDGNPISEDEQGRADAEVDRINKGEDA